MFESAYTEEMYLGNECGLEYCVGYCGFLSYLFRVFYDDRCAKSS